MSIPINGLASTASACMHSENAGMCQPPRSTKTLSVIARRAFAGFSLIELLVAVVIAGILAAVLYPSLGQYIQKSRRADAIEALTTIVQAQERFRGNASTYASELMALGIGNKSKAGHYSLSLTGIGPSQSFATGYVATAAAISTGRQAGDSKCNSLSVQLTAGSLIYSALNSQNADSTSECWPK